MPDLEDDLENSIFYFGCVENGGVDAKSTMAVDFFTELRKDVNPADGSVTLPHALKFWTPGNNGNYLANIQRELRLVFVDYEIDPNAVSAQNSDTAALLARIAELEEA